MFRVRVRFIFEFSELSVHGVTRSSTGGRNVGKYFFCIALVGMGCSKFDIFTNRHHGGSTSGTSCQCRVFRYEYLHPKKENVVKIIKITYLQVLCLITIYNLLLLLYAT